MDYFVVAENKPYHHWQLELLIESFKLHNLQDKLFIVLQESKEPPFADFTYNLSTIKRILHVPTDCHPVAALIYALNNKLIEQQFAIFHPDMLLHKPLPESDKNLVLQLGPATDGNKDIARYIVEKKRFNVDVKDIWVPVGDLKICNLPVAFFDRLLYWNGVDATAAWQYAILEYYGHIYIEGSYDFVSTLAENDPKAVIHYSQGLPPVFAKQMFTYKDGFAQGDLFETILQNGHTKAMVYMQDVAKSYLKNKPKKSEKLSFTIQSVKVANSTK